MEYGVCMRAFIYILYENILSDSEVKHPILYNDFSFVYNQSQFLLYLKRYIPISFYIGTVSVQPAKIDHVQKNIRNISKSLVTAWCRCCFAHTLRDANFVAPGCHRINDWLPAPRLVLRTNRWKFYKATCYFCGSHVKISRRQQGSNNSWA